MGLTSGCHQGPEWRNFDEHKDSKIKVGFPDYYKGIFIKRGDVSYLVCLIALTYLAMWHVSLLL